MAARAIDPGRCGAFARRPPSHSASVAVLAGALAGAASGPRYGWAVFGGLLSHVLRDAVEGKTPLLWPVARREHAPERVLLAEQRRAARRLVADQPLLASRRLSPVGFFCGGAAATPRRRA